MANTNGTTPTIRSARPGVSVAGEDDPVLSQRLMNLLVAETVQGLYRCEAVFSNWGSVGGDVGFLYFDRKVLDFGKAFAIKLGQETLFEGRVMGLEAQFPQGRPPMISVLAEDRFQDLRMTRRTRTFKSVSDADVFNSIASEHGLTANANVAGPTYAVLAQVNQSDLAFLRERARSVDAEVWVAGTALNARPRTDRVGGAFTLTYQQGLREFAVLADLAGQRSGVSVNGWDVGGKAALTYEATDSVLSGELNGFRSGASVLAAALGTRKESLAHTVPLSSQEARAEAEAVFKLSARRFLVGHGVAETDARIRVGNVLDLKGLGPLFSGKYYLSEVRHLFDGTRGLRTEFVAERPGLGT
jgi:phage protein D